MSDSKMTGGKLCLLITFCIWTVITIAVILMAILYPILMLQDVDILSRDIELRPGEAVDFQETAFLLSPVKFYLTIADKNGYGTKVHFWTNNNTECGSWGVSTYTTVPERKTNFIVDKKDYHSLYLPLPAECHNVMYSSITFSLQATAPIDIITLPDSTVKNTFDGNFTLNPDCYSALDVVNLKDVTVDNTHWCGNVFFRNKNTQKVSVTFSNTESVPYYYDIPIIDKNVKDLAVRRVRVQAPLEPPLPVQVNLMFKKHLSVIGAILGAIILPIIALPFFIIFIILLIVTLVVFCCGCN